MAIVVPAVRVVAASLFARLVAVMVEAAAVRAAGLDVPFSGIGNAAQKNEKSRDPVRSARRSGRFFPSPWRRDLARESLTRRESMRYAQAMSRNGSFTLSDVREPTLSLACEPCGQRGRYRVIRA